MCCGGWVHPLGEGEGCTAYGFAPVCEFCPPTQPPTCSRRIFFRATMAPVTRSRALYTTPYVPSPTRSMRWYCGVSVQRHRCVCAAGAGFTWEASRGGVRPQAATEAAAAASSSPLHRCSCCHVSPCACKSRRTCCSRFRGPRMARVEHASCGKALHQAGMHWGRRLHAPCACLRQQQPERLGTPHPLHGAGSQSALLLGTQRRGARDSERELTVCLAGGLNRLREPTSQKALRIQS